VFRATDIVLIALMVSAAGFTYRTKHEAERQLSEIRRIETKIRFEEDTIDLLKADWALLVQPARLQALTGIYKDQLGLETVTPEQIVSIDDIPARPPEAPETQGETVADILKADMTKTGAIPAPKAAAKPQNKKAVPIPAARPRAGGLQ
jgi:hypothetical protein